MTRDVRLLVLIAVWAGAGAGAGTRSAVPQNQPMTTVRTVEPKLEPMYALEAGQGCKCDNSSSFPTPEPPPPPAPPHMSLPTLPPTADPPQPGLNCRCSGPRLESIPSQLEPDIPVRSLKRDSVKEYMPRKDHLGPYILGDSCLDLALASGPDKEPSWICNISEFEISFINTISDADLKILKWADLTCCRNDLQGLALSNMKDLSSVEDNVLQEMNKLQSLQLYRLPELRTIPEKVFLAPLPALNTLRIVFTGLETFPALNMMNHEILHMVDLESNHIRRLPSHSVAVRTDSMMLDYNPIEEVEAGAFKKSQIAKLSFKGNSRLRLLHPEAFVGIRSLRTLDLSGTAITTLPTLGLEDLEELILTNTPALKVFPGAFHFKSLQRAALTYPYHCCAFSHPAAHRPQEYAKFQEMLREARDSECSSLNRTASVDKGREDFEDDPLPPQPLHLDLVDSGRMAGPLTSTAPPGVLRNGADETFHQEGVILYKLQKLCGKPSRPRPPVECQPAPDAFSPCEDLMGNWALRLSVWVVSVSALLGNGAVLLVLLSPRRRLSVPRFLMCHLAAADLAMGAYLLMLAVMDALSIGSYFNYAIDWQNGLGCQVAGFLTVFASELSVFALTLLTAERWYTITYAIHMNRRLRLSTAARIMAVGWVYAIVMAALPLVGVSGYDVTSICLPLRSLLPVDRVYLGVLLSFTGLAFLVICVCYCRMYRAVRGGQDSRAALQRSDVTCSASCAQRCAVQVAKRMTLLVLTDFACWAPIAFFGLTALLGMPLIDVPRTKILLVFFYPLNACANPYLYALLTRQFRRDLWHLLDRSAFFSTRTTRYKGAAGTTPRESSRRADNNGLQSGLSGNSRVNSRGATNAVSAGALRNREDSTVLELVMVGVLTDRPERTERNRNGNARLVDSNGF